MKRVSRILCLAACAVMALSATAMAADVDSVESDGLDESISIVDAGGPMKVAAVGLVSGKVTKQDDGSLLMAGLDDQETVVRLQESTPCVDAVTGLPLGMDKIQDGDELQVWVGPAMTMSLPPQVSALAVVGNIQDASAAPEYFEVFGLDQTVTIAIYPAPERSEVNLPTVNGDELCIPVSAQITPWLTRQNVTVDDIVPGTRVLVWRDESGVVNKVQMLPYTYHGYLGMRQHGEDMMSVVVNSGDDVGMISCKWSEDDAVMVPIRAVAEAAGYKVEWVRDKGAVVYDGDVELFSVMPGSDTAYAADGEYGLTEVCVIDSGTTYLNVMDAAHLLNLYLYLG